MTETLLRPGLGLKAERSYSSTRTITASYTLSQQPRPKHFPSSLILEIEITR